MAHFTTLSQHTINGTSMLAVTLTSSLGAASYIYQGAVDWPVALSMAVPSLLMTGIGARHARSMNDSALRLTLGFSLLLLSPLIALSKRDEGEEEEEGEVLGKGFSEQMRELKQKLEKGLRDNENLMEFPIVCQNAFVFAREYYDYLCLGLASGFTAGLLGLGGGIFMTTYMSLKGDVSQLTAVATSLAAIVPIGLSTSFHYTKHKHIHIPSAMHIAGAAMVTCAVTS
eukprot:CAMPEP_0201519860 /NCGR_PEP_ID=MMETSP0161_2-20130828/10306_1 /ASSEMBLY_ACC=CAM_ASM_000251 /TAXON_ID=180227 /ORGANISM="Neoparamoeba aestuarina, Strain SoJaBio B1-5/56/2" /LENGTH=227 /DNA_ID=CAMNT_0047918027 /DNA_START=358 /DNA_END=1038 /DNA_ORIENTATION=+